MTPHPSDPVRLVLSESSLVLLVGPSGCGKSTFARRRFAPTEVVSSDHFRAIVCDDETNQAASRDAFTILHEVVACRLAWRRFTSRPISGSRRATAGAYYLYLYKEADIKVLIWK